MDAADASERVAVLLSERGVTLEGAAEATGLDVERLASVIDGQGTFAMQEIVELAAALNTDARFIAFGDAGLFAMRADDQDAVSAAQEKCRRALDALLGLEALVR